MKTLLNHSNAFIHSDYMNQTLTEATTQPASTTAPFKSLPSQMLEGIKAGERLTLEQWALRLYGDSSFKSQNRAYQVKMQASRTVGSHIGFDGIKGPLVFKDKPKRAKNKRAYTRSNLSDVNPKTKAKESSSWEPIFTQRVASLKRLAEQTDGVKVVVLIEQIILSLV